MEKKLSADECRILSKNMRISLYDRYILFEKKLSDILFDKNVKGIDFHEKDNNIIFFPGNMFDLGKKGKNAVIYSKQLADFLRAKLHLPEYEGVQKIYFSYNNEYFIIPTNSNSFLQYSSNSCKFQQIPTEK